MAETADFDFALDKQSADFLRQLQNPHVFEAFADDMAQRVAKDIAKKIRAKAKPFDYTTKGRKSVEATPEGDVKALLHMAVQNYGRGAGKRMPPPSEIEKWARAKLGVENMGYVIARSIGENGTPARGYVQAAIKEVAGNNKRLQDHYDKALATQLRKIRGRGV